MSDVGNEVLSDAVPPRVRRKRPLARATAGYQGVAVCHMLCRRCIKRPVRTVLCGPRICD